METMKVWNLYEIEVDPEDGDDGVERHIGTYASVVRARQAVTDLHPDSDTVGNLTHSGGVVEVVSARAGLWVTSYRIARMEVQS